MRINYTVIPNDFSEKVLFDNEIDGTKVKVYKILPQIRKIFQKQNEDIRIIIVISGTIDIVSEKKQWKLSEKDVYVQSSKESIEVSSECNAVILELLRAISEDEYKVFSNNNTLPYFMRYKDAPTYSEDCKSKKTISRMLIPARIVPRFAMGSVQTEGKDKVEKHKHPILEQFFFGFKENNCTAMIDDICLPFKGNTLLHIPLGSNHGIESKEKETVHYIWMDFLLDDKGLSYLDSAHKMNSEK